METKVQEQVEDLSAAYLSGSTTNELIFRKTIAAANAATNADDVLVNWCKSTCIELWYN